MGVPEKAACHAIICKCGVNAAITVSPRALWGREGLRIFRISVDEVERIGI
jgi:hypothetical protein